MDELAQVLRHVRITKTDPGVLVGLDPPDDAGVYRVAPDLALVQTVDFFTPIVDDPKAWGRIAAANALSDVYAMGGRPVTALNLVGWPRSLDLELLGLVLEGAGMACEEAGVTVLGGHSVDDPEPKFGLAVTGLVHPDRVVRTRGGTAGCALVLTKPLGMGIITTGIKEGRTSAEAATAAARIMATLNRSASEAMLEVGVEAATDVTGFGLIGHLAQMLAPGISARLSFGEVPVLSEAFPLAAKGVLPGGSKRNRAAMQARVRADGLDDPSLAVLFDAQTSGGLLMAVRPERADGLVRALAERGVEWSARIGELVRGDGMIEVVA